MKRFLLPLIAALVAPTAANAESYWLIIRYVSGVSIKAGVALEKIEMNSMEQCEMMGAKWMGSKETRVEKATGRSFAYDCLVGK